MVLCKTKGLKMGILGNMHWIANRVYMKHILTRQKFTRRRHFLVACMPKSGSSYLTAVLGGMPDMKIISLVPGYDRREQELDICKLRAANGLNYVAHHHVRYSKPTGVLFEHFGVKPIVLVRNIFDVVISLRDHFRNESLEGSMAYVASGMENLPDDELEKFIAQMMIPWYFNFYMSWIDCKSKCFLRYEDLIQSPESVVEGVCEQISFKLDKEVIANSIQNANQSFTRKNVGITGRGKHISEDTKKIIYDMASYYKDVDFSPIGI